MGRFLIIDFRRYYCKVMWRNRNSLRKVFGYLWRIVKMRIVLGRVVLVCCRNVLKLGRRRFRRRLIILSG